jgi:hypothetical protein
LPLSLKAKPGETISTDLRIKNGGTRTETLSVSLLKFSANNDQGQPKLAEREEGDTYFDWVSFSEKTFKAEPNEWKTIKMTIKIPSSAALGYYYAPVFQRANAELSDDSTSIEGGAATLVLLEVESKEARRDMNIVAFNTKRKTYEFLPASFTVKLHNNGNIHGMPAGTIFINKGEELIATINVNNTRGNILPNSDREFTVEWKDGFPLFEPRMKDGKIVNGKDGEAETDLKWRLENSAKLRYGKYTASLLMVYDDGQRDVPLEATLTFWVIPWRIVAVILLIVAVIGFGLFTIVRRIWRGTHKVKSPKSKTPKGPDHAARW